VKALCAFGSFLERIHLILLDFPSWHRGCCRFPSARSGFVLWGPDHQPGIGGRDEGESLGYTATSRRNSRRMGRLCQRVVHRRHLRHHLRRHDGGSRTRNTSAPWLWPCRARWRGLETAPPKPKEVIGRPRTSHEGRFSLRVRGTKLAQFSSGGLIYRLASIPPCIGDQGPPPGDLPGIPSADD
jgi:hypothetical protein